MTDTTPPITLPPDAIVGFDDESFYVLVNPETLTKVREMDDGNHGFGIIDPTLPSVHEVW